MKELLSGPLWSNPCPRPVGTLRLPTPSISSLGTGRTNTASAGWRGWTLTRWDQKVPGFILGVSLNGGTPKSSILIGFSIINHPFWGTTIFGNTHMIYYHTWLKTRRLKVHPMKIISGGLGCSQIPFPPDCPGHIYIYTHLYIHI